MDYASGPGSGEKATNITLDKTQSFALTTSKLTLTRFATACSTSHQLNCLCKQYETITPAGLSAPSTIYKHHHVVQTLELAAFMSVSYNAFMRCICCGLKVFGNMLHLQRLLRVLMLSVLHSFFSPLCCIKATGCRHEFPAFPCSLYRKR